MKYYNINNKSERVDFKDAIVLGQARDGGLFFPEQIPIWNKAFIESIQKKSKVEIGFEIMKPYVGDALPDDVLMDILQEVLSFEFPLKKINSIKRYISVNIPCFYMTPNSRISFTLTANIMNRYFISVS